MGLAPGGPSGNPVYVISRVLFINNNNNINSNGSRSAWAMGLAPGGPSGNPVYVISRVLFINNNN